MGTVAQNMKVTLAICTNRDVKSKTLDSLLRLVNETKDVEFDILVASRGYTISENRNYCVAHAQKNGSDYLFFVDDDMTFPSDTLTRLLAHKKEVVGVNSYSRCLPLSSTVGKMDEKGEYMHPDKYPKWEMEIPGEMFKAYFVGAGVLLINMEVFNRIEKPYFSFETYEEDELKGMVKNGEDGLFCDNVRKAGMDVWCDGTIHVGHIGDFEYKREQLITTTNSPSKTYSFTITDKGIQKV